MIKKLRIKFIVLSVLSAAVVLVVILGVVNVMSYGKVVEEADWVLELIAENNGRFPDVRLRDGEKKGRREFPNGMRRDMEFSNMSPELPFELRYFSVLLSEQGKCIQTDVGRIAAVDEDVAAEYAEAVARSSRQGGFYGDYRYRRQDEGTGERIIFLDCRRPLRMFRAFLAVSVAVSVVGLTAVCLLAFLLSGRAVRPFVESYEKQKRFITDAGHEIKTPLAIIDADVAVSEMECGENEWLSDIQKQTERLKDLTNDLIYLSKMEEGRGGGVRIEFPISEVALQMVQTFERLAKAQNKSFAYQIDPMLSYFGDEKDIRRLLSVLLDNAVKYSDEGGEISASLQGKGRMICLSVYNTTEAIGKDVVCHMFDRFYRADPSRNSQTGGYGIGLSIAKAIVAAHKGQITAETKDGKSLEVRVDLPFSKS